MTSPLTSLLPRTTVGELFQSLDRDAVIQAIELINPNFKAPHCRHGLQRAWAEIQAIRSTIATDIVCQVGLFSKSNDHEPKQLLLCVNPRAPAYDECDDLAFMPWRKWMSMQIIVLPEAENPSKIEILACILCEMTFYGFSEDEIERAIADFPASNLPSTIH